MLIVRVGAMGDVLHALSAAVSLRAARPDWQIDWVVDERWLPLLQSDGHGPVVEVAYPVPIREWKRFPRSPALLRSLRHLYALRRQRYDVVVDLQGTLRSAVIGRLAGGSRLAGYADPRETPARYFYARRLRRKGAHVVEQGTALLGDAIGVELGTDFPAAAAMLPLDETAEVWAEALFLSLGRPGRLAVLAPSAGWPAKQWPANLFSMLARALALSGWTILVNNPGERDAVALEVLGGAGGTARSLACTVAEFSSILRRATLLVGNDSGPTHLAAALGVPLVALFGPTDPMRNGPWGPGPLLVLRDSSSTTSYRHVAEPDPGLARITVEQVLGAIHAVTKPRS